MHKTKAPGKSGLRLIRRLFCVLGCCCLKCGWNVNGTALQCKSGFTDGFADGGVGEDRADELIGGGLEPDYDGSGGNQIRRPRA